MPLGVWGLAAVAFLDSAFLPLPTAIDVWVISRCIRNPAGLLLYASLATAGSVCGCLVLYWVARAGGHRAAEKKVGKERLARIRNWIEHHEFLTVMVPAIMPPPTPFKAFIIAAGVTEVHLGKFVLALTFGRAVRYLGEGFLAVRYGPRVWDFALAHGLPAFGVFTACILGVILAMLVRQRQRRATIE